MDQNNQNKNQEHCFGLSQENLILLLELHLRKIKGYKITDLVTVEENGSKKIILKCKKKS